MPLHEPVVLLLVHGEPALARELLGQLDRESVRRLQLEGVVPGDLSLGRGLLEDRHPVLQGHPEALLLGGEHAPDLLPVLDELRIRVSHLLDHDLGEAGQERRLHPDPQPVLGRAADDAAQDVAAPLVRRRHALGGDERHPAAVVGEHAVRLRGVLGRAVRDAGLAGDPVHDQLEAVRVVDGRDVLHHARVALQPPAGVDVLGRQLGERAVGMELVGHEDEVPELEEALAARAARQAVVVAATDLLAPVPVHLRVRAARAWAAHRPEVLGRRQRDDSLRRHADLLPEADRLLVGTELQAGVASVDGDPDAVPVELQPFLDELGRVLDRALLEVLAEREVAEHLEEGEVERVEADLVDVLGAEDLLARGRQRRGRCLAAEEERHLRLHAGARVERRAVVGARDQGRGRAPEMALLLEERLEPLPQLGRRAHGGHCRNGRDPAIPSDRAVGRSDAGCTTAPQTPLPRREDHAAGTRRARRGGRRRSGSDVGPTRRPRTTRPPCGSRRRPRRRPGGRPRVPHPKPQAPPRLLSGPPLLAGDHVRVRAPAAILVDADTGRVLWADRPHERRKIASLTKIMTATLALREVPWGSTITVNRSVTRVPLVREGLRTGEHVKAWKLFYSLLLYSGNDDANQLAISSAGSVHAFLGQMNDEARKLGLHDTHYTSPSGVRDRGNYSTPVGPRGPHPLRVPEPALRPAREDEADPGAVVGADQLEDLPQQQLPPARVPRRERRQDGLHARGGLVPRRVGHAARQEAHRGRPRLAEHVRRRPAAAEPRFRPQARAATVRRGEIAVACSRDRSRRGSRNGEHRRLPPRRGHRPLRAVRRRDGRADGAGLRRGREGAPDARPHACDDRRDPAPAARSDRRLRDDRADAEPVHPARRREPAATRGDRLRPERPDAGRAGRRRRGDAVGRARARRI